MLNKNTICPQTLYTDIIRVVFSRIIYKTCESDRAYHGNIFCQEFSVSVIDRRTMSTESHIKLILF